MPVPGAEWDDEWEFWSVYAPGIGENGNLEIHDVRCVVLSRRETCLCWALCTPLSPYWTHLQEGFSSQNPGGVLPAGASRRWLGRGGGAPLNGISVLVTETPQRSSAPCTVSGAREKAPLWTRKGSLTRRPCWHLDLDFSVSGTVGNKFLSTGCSFSGVLL